MEDPNVICERKRACVYRSSANSRMSAIRKLAKCLNLGECQIAESLIESRLVLICRLSGSDLRSACKVALSASSVQVAEDPVYRKFAHR
jgi:hypothetical protein